MAISQAVNAMQSVVSPNREAQIEGLPEGGQASNLRHLLTDFGSPWQGQGRDRDGYDITPGQAFDVADLGVDISRGLGGGGGPWSWPVATFASLDVAISAGTSKPGQMLGNAVGAASAQAFGIGAWFLGGAGAAVGAAAGAGVGGFVGGPVGAAVGTRVGSFAGKWGIRIVAPIMLDPVIRRIGIPINKAVAQTQGRVHFGGFRDSQQAYTMRQRSLMEMRNGLQNSYQYLGHEANLMHQ